MNITELHTIEEWNAFVSQNNSSLHGVVILKFSPRCPISRSVEREFDAWCRNLADDAGVVCLKVDVVSSRPLSQHLARQLNVRHESPQAIWLTSDQQVQWHASHYSVSKQALTTQLHAA
jgi:bacillithiol system protein YtxJ